MEKIRLKNLRSLYDTGEINLSPLTVLVGKNSSGKSTFIRFFPLMKQTLEIRTNEPILWYGRYVDYGSYKESLNYKNKLKPIVLEFEFKLPKNYVLFEFARYSFINRLYRGSYDREDISNLDFKLAIKCAEKIVEEVKIQFEDHLIIMRFEKNERTILEINGKLYDENNFKPIFMRESANIIPQISFKDENNGNSVDTFFLKDLLKTLKDQSYASTSENTLKQLISSIPIGSSQNILDSLKSQETTAKKLIQNLRKLELNDSLFEEIKNNFLGLYLNKIISICNRYLEVSFSSVKYIAPLRASAERYYRIQGLSVDEIDPQGANIPMILHNMIPKDRYKFNSWLRENFGFEVSTVLEGGHTSLRIKYEDKSHEINLADTGFGYSQILPIILVIWQASTQNSNLKSSNTWYRYRENFENSSFTVVIEQPELHLHPAMQAKLIDIFSKLISNAAATKLNIKIIIETHSETMLNRIGYLIAKKNINKDSVNVLIFNNIDTYESEIESTSYSERGHLKNWPIGFFSPEDM